MTQYYSRTDIPYAGDSNFTIPFSYIDKTDIHVYINDTLISTWVWLNDSQINITSTLSTGDVVSIRRITPIDEKIVTYQNMSMVLNDDNLNLSQDQVLNAVQEVYDNNVSFQIDVNAQIDEIDTKVDTANATANQALSNSETAISIANEALSNSEDAVATANAAETKADNAVSTANTASSNASQAVSTANEANTNAQAAVSTANSAADDASEALSKANTAISTANTAKDTADTAKDTADEALADSATALANSETAINTANDAADDATEAVATANTANTNASNAVSTANSANSAANSAVSTANSASTAANNAVSTANTASTNASAAIARAEEAIEIAQTAVSQGLTPATATSLGGIKVGDNLSITAEGVLSADAQSITVDDELSSSSENPVQNKVINSALGDKQDALTAGTDLEIIEGSTGHELPEGYTECEYISNTADVVRDIALSGDNIDTKVTIYAKLDRTLSTSQVLLSFGQGTGNSWFGSPTNYNVWGNGVENANLSWSSSTIYSQITINIDYTSSNYATVNGEIYRPDTMSIRTFTRTGGTNSVGNFTLFGSNGSSHYYARASIYYAKFEQGGLVVSELIPARQESDGKYGLYDIVRDRFFSSSYFTGQEASFNPETVINFTNESGYVTSTALNGYATQSWVGQQGYLTGITSAQVTTALGYTPYNASNPNGYTSNVGTVTSVNNELPDANGNVTIQSGSSRNIGEIVTSTIPLTDAGLHLLDGALISGSGSYSAFVDYIAGLVIDYPDLFDTEANWQSAVTQYGICEKFVYDSTNNTVRLPKYGNQIYTGGTVPVLGNGMSVGLTTNTNNLGTLGISTDYATNRTYAYAHTPATLPATLTGVYLTNVDRTAVGITTDATKSGIISNPEDISMDCYYYIVVATSTKTDIQVDIDEIATDLNGKADTDFSNVTDVAKIAMANASMPSDTYENLTLGASGTTYTAPADGWFTVRITSTGGTGIAYVTLNSSELLITRDSNYHPSNSTSIGLYCSIPVKKGSVVTVNYSVMSTVSNKTLRFIYAEGSKSEAI